MSGTMNFRHDGLKGHGYLHYKWAAQMECNLMGISGGRSRGL
jgi:hypothetical protein